MLKTIRSSWHVLCTWETPNSATAASGHKDRVWTLPRAFGFQQADTEDAEKSAPLLPVGVRWSAESQESSFALSAELANLGFEDAELLEAAWASSQDAVDLADLHRNRCHVDESQPNHNPEFGHYR